jgi:cytochrome c-type biogenesis protein CcmF
MEIQYIGEHLFPGKLGNFFVLLGFLAAIIASIAYFKAFRAEDLSEEQQSWKNFARGSFYVHAFAVLGIIATLFWMITQNFFEYQYVWQHSSSDLPLRYMLSCFWEGQEGSFLLWSFWHVVLGLILIKTSKSWELPVMAVFSSVQIFLSSMLLGVFIFNYRWGSNPFLLLREHPEFSNLPFTKVPDYLRTLDGRGLNPLLRNYWMTIHPPTLFLGFASTIVPFAYSIAALLNKRTKEWIEPALPWTFFSVMILGTGILMGGAWAYEALSFGGFWAWDPVENASLVPWLTLVAAAHLMLIYKSRGKSLLTATILTVLTFILILYSTFLTRSGILGNTSVHAFTDLGMSGQLLLFLFSYILISAWLIIKERKTLRDPEGDDHSTSREFWMFIASLTLLVSAFQISFTTSIPVVNKIFNLNLAPPSKPIQHYNSWQIPFAIVTAFLMSATLYLKYKKTNLKPLGKQLILPALLTLVASGITIWLLNMNSVFNIILLWCSYFSFFANANYLIAVLNGRIFKGGAPIAHAGFALILLGALISAGHSKVISRNTSGYDITQLGKDFNNFDNILLMQGDTLRMGDYFITFKGKRQVKENHYFDIDYLTEGTDGKKIPAFTLSPLVQENPKMGNAAEPDTRHFLWKDVYTHITYAKLEQAKHVHDRNNEYPHVKSHKIAAGDTIFVNQAMIVFEGIDKNVDAEKYKLKQGDLAVAARLRILTVALNSQITASPVFIIRGNSIIPIEEISDKTGMKFRFTGIDPNTGKIDLEVAQKENEEREFVIMKAIIFPMINLLWTGCILMMLGTGIAVWQRFKSASTLAGS